MWKSFGPIVGCCLAAMPLLGCVGGYTALPPQVGPPPAVGAAAVSEPGVDTTPTEAPATVLVFLPGAVEFGDVAARDPRLWAAQGFDVVMPPPGDLVRLAADQQAAIERLLTSARALANAPIWVGPGPPIDAALVAPQFGRGVSGVVMTSVSSGTGSCSESFFYEDAGTGAPPKVEVKRSGHCGASMPAPGVRQPSVLPTPAPRLNQPRLIEASAAGKKLPPAAKAHHLAELTKPAPPG